MLASRRSISRVNFRAVMQVLIYMATFFSVLQSIAAMHGAHITAVHVVSSSETVSASDSASLRTNNHDSGSPIFCVAPLPKDFMYDEEDLKEYDGTLEGCGESGDATRSFPFGQVISRYNDLFRTNQYALEYIFRKHMIESPLTSESCEAADIVFVPLTLLCQPQYKEVQDNIARFTKDPGAFLPYMKAKPHFIVLPRCMQFTYYFDFESLRLAAATFTFLTIEPRPGSTDTDVLVVPYPARYHHHDGLARNRFIASALQSKNKKWLAFENFKSGHDKTGLRQKIAQVCMHEPAQCNHVEVDISYKDHLGNAEEWYHNASSSWYCIQPPGGSPTRRSTFDCLLAGSIPVFFTRETVDMLPWNKIVDPSRYTIVASSEDMMFMSLLDKISVDDRMKYVTYFQEFAHIFQYSITPSSGLIKWGNAMKIDHFDDAFTFSLKTLVRNACGRKLLPQHKCAVLDN